MVQDLPQNLLPDLAAHDLEGVVRHLRLDVHCSRLYCENVLLDMIERQGLVQGLVLLEHGLHLLRSIVHDSLQGLLW